MNTRKDNFIKFSKSGYVKIGEIKPEMDLPSVGDVVALLVMTLVLTKLLFF